MSSNDQETLPLLFLHGLEGTPNGRKVTALRQLEHATEAQQARPHRRVVLRSVDMQQQTPFERLQSIRHAYDHCATPPYVVGSSLGGWLAALLAAERPLHGLLLLAPAFFAEEVPPLPAHIPHFDRFMKEAQQLNRRPRITVPTHVIIAEHDRSIDRKGQALWLQENPHATHEVWDDEHRLGRSLERIVACARTQLRLLLDRKP